MPLLLTRSVTKWLSISVLLITSLLLGACNSDSEEKLTNAERVSKITVYFQDMSVGSEADSQDFYVEDADAIRAFWISYLDDGSDTDRLWFRVFSNKGKAQGDIVINMDTVKMIAFAP